MPTTGSLRPRGLLNSTLVEFQNGCAFGLLALNSLAALWLFCYGINAYWLTFRRHRGGNTAGSFAPPVDWPVVTVQLPIYNELYVCRRLLAAVCALDYPAGALQIQVLDDSTDETGSILAAAVAEYRERGYRIDYLARRDRRGFKAGALAAALPEAQGEFIAIFDADFLPPADWLKRTLVHFGDPEVGLVQTRWAHTNADYSLLTRLQALGIDGHFAIEQQARYGNHYLLNFNGTAGIWRKAAITGGGGWQADTLAEDLDLSYRSQLAGWRALYDNRIVAPAELPVTMVAYKLQQARWAKGSIQCARKLLGPVWAAPLGAAQKLQATLHLTGYAVHPLMLFIVLASVPLLLTPWVGDHPLSRLWGVLMVPATFGPPVLYLAAQRELHPSHWWRALPRIVLLAVLGTGLSLANSRAVLAGLVDRGGSFRRTPKFAVVAPGDRWQSKRYQLPLDPLSFAELGLGAYALWALVLAIAAHAWGVLPFLLLYVSGYGYVGGLGISQHLQSSRRQEHYPSGGLPSQLGN
ncbi:cellulose synthase family protein [Gloeobacter kilaueensis]|uniref:N-glycosyltransferase n=1 Tax=Gloeobacter kilaueensis (strain ATCC BAA-2537 / CCAP 1431/1 / ULC 316 / JS1) TaxID=1183438 RepID=U5QLP1_GLOK1|nr:cellulose synthase family protein [Gloeobacter kilaueensis]AGY59892.1 N-glycosyltransferase [Gloeobacter kilaueensis JS1]